LGFREIWVVAATFAKFSTWNQPPMRQFYAGNHRLSPLMLFTKERLLMKISSRIRTALFAFAAVAGVGIATAPAAHAETCNIRFSVFKAGWFIGGSGGSGAMTCRGRSYPITIGGISAGLVFGGSKTWFQGTVSNIHRPSDVAGVFGAAGAGGAFGPGAQVIVLRNERGATLRLSGRQVGAQINADLSGMAISLR
jgi:hypothetical protein